MMPPSVPTPGRPWGLWATAGFSVWIFAVHIVIEIIVIAVYALVLSVDGSPEDAEFAERVARLGTSGTVLTVALIASASICSALVIFVAWLRRGMTVVQYLCLHPVGWPRLAGWLGVALVLLVAWEVVTTMIGREPVPEFMKDAFATAESPLLFGFAVVLAAPVFEELFFRGFLLESLRATRLGAWGAVLLPSAIWAVAHIQYGAYEIISIFILGMVLGYARLATKSLWTPIAMHAFNNLLALLQVATLTI